MPTRGETTKRLVLDALSGQSTPLSAYDILGALRKTNPKIAPPTIYRALSALAKDGRVHRLESLNAYISCQCAAHLDGAVLSICDDCGQVEETLATGLKDHVSALAAQSGFAPKRHVIEVHGTCATCADNGAAT